MKQKHKIIIGLGVLVVAFLLIQSLYSDKFSKDNSNADKDINKNQSALSSTRYFKESSDKIVLSAANEELYSNNPSTTITYYAVDSSNNLAHFKEGDKVFVRVLGITQIYTQNKEIFHAQGNDTIFSGSITFPGVGVYLIKACLGPKMNVDSDGNKIWPFGCFEDQTSIKIKVNPE